LSPDGSPIPILTPSQSNKLLISGVSGSVVETWSSSQGLTFDAVTILITPDAIRLADDRTWFTALTRSRGNVFLLRGFPLINEYLTLIHSRPLLRALFAACAGESTSWDPLSLPDLSSFSFIRRKIRGDRLPTFRVRGGDSSSPEDLFDMPTLALDSTPPDRLLDEFPQSASLYSFLREVLPPAGHSPVSLPFLEPPLASTFPREDPIFLRDHFASLIRDRTDRELVRKGLLSNQFPDLPTFKSLISSSDRSLHPTDPFFLPLFHRFRQDDAATFAAAIEKRITLLTPEQNRANFADASVLAGPALWNSLCRALQLSAPIPWNAEFFEVCHIENQRNRVFRKPLEMLLAAHTRDEPDLDIRKIQIIMKQEYKKKSESMAGDAKAGQTLAVFHTAVLFTFGGLGRYLTYHLEKLLPSNIYIHLRRSPSDLSEWLKTNSWEDFVDCVDNDYTAFDQSQDATALFLEIELMRHFNVPSDMIELYYWLKTESRSWLGPFGIMRFTGEWSTFLFNTLFSIAYSHTKYSFSPGMLQCYGGDDSSFNGVPSLRPDWPLYERLFSLTSKEIRSDRPTFCSWRLTSQGIFKDPALVQARLHHAFANLTAPLVLPSYFLEHAFAYDLGENLHQYLTPFEESCHSANSSIFHQNRRLIPFFSTQVTSSRIRALWMRVTERFPSYQRKTLQISFLSPEEELEAQLLTLLMSNPLPSGPISPALSPDTLSSFNSSILLIPDGPNPSSSFDSSTPSSPSSYDDFSDE